VGNHGRNPYRPLLDEVEALRIENGGSGKYPVFKRIFSIF
jgi:hypothetical protein